MAKSTCSISECERPVTGWGWCGLHYQRWQRYGDAAAEPFHKPLYRIDPSGCWLWNGELDTKGYGMVRKQVRRVKSVKRAHRVIYERHRGPIAEGLELDHLCSVRSCVNPWHLEPVTHRENVRRALLRTHCMRGHEFTPENTKPMPKGKRTCRTCFNASQIRYLARKKAREEAA